MYHSQIEEILKSAVSGNEELKEIEDKFHSVASEIDNMANGRDADLDDILRRAKELIYRIFEGHRSFLDSKWSGIEDKIEKNLKGLKK
jgi:hypothetical protein